MTRRQLGLAFVVLLSLSLPAGVAGVAGPTGVESGATDRQTIESPAPDRGPTGDRAIPDGGASRESISSTDTTAEAAAGGADEEAIHRQLSLRHLPDRPGEFEVSVAIEVPDRVTALNVTLPSAADVRGRDGFRHREGDTWTWGGTTGRPSITFAMPANETEDGLRAESPITADEFSNASPGAGAVEEAATTDVEGTAGPVDDGGTGTAVEEAPVTDVGGTERATVGELDVGSAQGSAHSFAGTGEWSLVRVPELALGWRYRGDTVRTDRTVTVDGEGATGGEIAYFGAVEEYAESVRGERIRLVVPEVATLEESPDDVLASLAAVSRDLRVGSRNEEFFVVAAPTGTVEWASRGLQYGADDAWVAADSRLDDPRNVWIHEYVHARQAFTRTRDGTTAEAAWLPEGVADYYAALSTARQDRIDFRTFADTLSRGSETPYADGVLADRSTWRDRRTAYVKGALVVGELDRQVRLETDGAATFQDVFRRLNGRENERDAAQLTERAFLDAVERDGGSTARDAAGRYTQTPDAPSMWSRSAHREAFDRPTAVFEYAADSATVSGPYRDETPDVGSLPTLVPGERVAITVGIENAGDRTGTYDATLLVDGGIVDSGDGRLDTGERATETLAWTPEAPGRHEVVVGDERVTVRVERPAEGAVTDLAVDPEPVVPGEDATVTATVENGADRPAETVVRFRTPDGVAHEERVTLAPGAATTVETTVRFPDRGRYEVAVDDRTAIVTVDPDARSGGSEDGPVDGSGGTGDGRDGSGGTNGDPDGDGAVDDYVDDLSGFGATATLVAFATIATLARRRTRP